ncbi:hypothetical protein CDD81_2598 [Ophiocordyceps australis]|uniref:Major facilitator superfamily (MFS) profile domain-containing protein n=1 Tax=Ophiocordyceps australis TaxID=1399860 RepID=A0A2C5XXC0_9HYPO|nr:hypothetical protein CDD81_2598 [Ophiocordyceps australis]
MPVRRLNRGFLGSDSAALSPQLAQQRRQLRCELDLNSWNMRIWGVAASGFLTDSYNLFSTNVILASVIFVYDANGSPSTALVVNLATLVGSVVGQLLFGFLADWFGRTRLYGIELLLVIISTIGVATTSNGHNDMSFLALFIWWRFVMGIGIGAEYPLSAVITSEWSSTKSRATMLSTVFLMQPIGQALAQLVGLFVLFAFNASKRLQDKRCGLDQAHHAECLEAFDGFWRIVIGSGAIPALLAIIFRFFLYDCGLYSLEVRNKPALALENTQRIYGVPSPPLLASLDSQPLPTGLHVDTPVQFSRQDLHRYLIKEGNWRYLVGASATWFFLDVSFYGLSLDNRRTLSDLWATAHDTPIDESLPCWHSQLPNGQSTVPSWQQRGLPPWQTNLQRPCSTLYDVLVDQAKQYLLTVSLASIAGSICFVVLANRFPRRQWLTASFFVLALVLAVTGAVYYRVNHSPASPVTVVLVAICHFLFNFGANTLTFIIPAEIFPTCYRCTCHGIAAAAGKLGSIVALLVVYAINQAYDSSTRQGLIFLLFGFVAVFGALFAWAYLPDLERRSPGPPRSLETKTLEEMGEGWQKAQQMGEAFTFRDKCESVRLRWSSRHSSI